VSYDTIEAALQTILRYDTTTFANSAQVSRGDWRIMDSGRSPLAVLYAGAYAENDTDTTLTEFSVTWTVKLDLILKYTDETTRVTFAQKRDTVLEQIMKYPMLHALASATAKLGRITSDGDPLPIFDKDGNGPFFLMQTFSIPVSEVLTIAPTG
jgi:hypothetical protein